VWYSLETAFSYKNLDYLHLSYFLVNSDTLPRSTVHVILGHNYIIQSRLIVLQNLDTIRFHESIHHFDHFVSLIKTDRIKLNVRCYKRREIKRKKKVNLISYKKEK